MNRTLTPKLRQLIALTTVIALISIGKFSAANAQTNTEVETKTEAEAEADTDTDTEAKPKWELGMAGAILSIPHYIGSDQRHSLPVAAPFIIYRGDFLKSDREGVRGEFLRTPSLNLDVSFSFGLPVKSNNNAREGMPHLYLSGQIGPRINWTILEPESGPTVSLHLPFRYARDVRNTNLGWVAEPSVRLERKKLGSQGKFSARLDTGLLYARRQYHQYYYEIQPEFATGSRPAYVAESGLNHVFIHLSGTYKLSKKLTLGGFARWKSLSPGVVSDSPLVRDKQYLAAGLGISWIFKQSQ